jgi:hypothetical protein
MKQGIVAVALTEFGGEKVSGAAAIPLRFGGTAEAAVAPCVFILRRLLADQGGRIFGQFFFALVGAFHFEFVK